MSTYSLKLLQAYLRARRTVLLALGLFIVSFALVACTSRGEAQKTELAPPVDYQQVADIDLSAQPRDAETLGQFSLDETATVGVFYSIRDIDTPYFDLRLVGPDGNEHVILHSEDFRTDQHGGGLWEESLPPGAYHLELTASQSPGALAVYWKYR